MSDSPATRRIVFLFLICFGAPAFSQETLTEKQLSAMYEHGVAFAAQINENAIKPMKDQISELNSRPFPEAEPKLREVQKGRNQTNYQAELRKAKAAHKEAMKTYLEKKASFDAEIEKDVAKIRDRIADIQSNNIDWVFPSLQIFNAREGQIGMFGRFVLQPNATLKAEFYPFEFWRKRGESDSEFWVDKAPMVVAGLPSSKFAKGQEYNVRLPLIQVAPTDPDRYLQFRVLNEPELKKIKEYVGEKTGKSIKFDWIDSPTK
jgi:hypothetical protein